MNKVTKWFSKKKKQVICDEIETDARPEQPRDIPGYFPKRDNLNDNFQPDNCSGNHETVNHISDDIETELHEPLIADDPLGNLTDLNLPTIVHEDAELSGHQLSNNEAQEIPGLSVTSTTQRNVSPAVCLPDSLSTTSNLCRVSSSTNVAVHEADSMQNVPSDLVSNKPPVAKKNGGNTYVITISNSTHFHIGTQKTINYPDPGQGHGNIQNKELQFTKGRNGKLLGVDSNLLLDIKDKLSQDDLVEISLCVREKWRELARNLGMEESKIQELEELSDDDYSLIVFELLHRYLNRYPNTTVGFMVNVLSKSNEFEAIRKLTDKR